MCAMQEVFRQAALEHMKSRVQGSLRRANASATADMDRLLEQQAELSRRDREVSAGVDSVQVRHSLAQPPTLGDLTWLPAIHSASQVLNGLTRLMASQCGS